MPLLYKTTSTVTETHKLEGFTCNKCLKFFDDIVNTQEMFYALIDGGYGSVFSDGDEFEIVLCQDCAKELFGQYLTAPSSKVW